MVKHGVGVCFLFNSRGTLGVTLSFLPPPVECLMLMEILDKDKTARFFATL